MLQQKEISNLQKDEPINHYFLIKKIETKVNKNEKEYLLFELGDHSGSIIGFKWTNISEFHKQLEPGEIVKIKGKTLDYNGQIQISIDNIYKPSENENIPISYFLPRCDKDIEDLKIKFWKRIDNIKDDNLKKLLKVFFTPEVFQKFCLAPAGKSWHHAYIGGLLEHVIEMIRLADLICDLHKEINRDLLIAGCVLHDVGKIDELFYDRNFDYTDEGKLNGHILIGISLLNKAINKLDNFPQELERQLIHLIASHQGRLEYGSPIEPKTLEAIALHGIDELSSKVNAYKSAIKQDLNSGSKWTRYQTLINSMIYIPDNFGKN
jgi:3'-5' exoribonuclease